MTTETHIEMQRVVINRNSVKELDEAIHELELRGYTLQAQGLEKNHTVTKSSYAAHRPSRWRYGGSAENNQKFKAVMVREYERVIQ